MDKGKDSRCRVSFEYRNFKQTVGVCTFYCAYEQWRNEITCKISESKVSTLVDKNSRDCSWPGAKAEHYIEVERTPD